jgi:hypothetical protein
VIAGLNIPETRGIAFARCVAAAMDGPILRYSSRLDLMRQARRTGIAPFEANLIIAAVQHRAGAIVEPPKRQAAAKAQVIRLKPAHRLRGIVSSLAVALALQSLLVLVVWSLLS